MEAIDAILTRKSVRSFSDREIEDEKIELLMKAAMAAPSAMNKQPWEFYVAKSEESKNAIFKAMPFGKYQPKIIIIPCIRDIDRIPVAPDFACCDLGAACQNIL